ncbi:MAG TPA: LysR family transcriptional regulator, partial [Citreicella sp.]|nr:LysR family transcriptional regulator [Citreicella sp.]
RLWEETGRLVRPFAPEVDMGSYWLTWPQTRKETQGMRSFRTWLTAALA